MVDVTDPTSRTTGLNLQTLRRLKFWVWFQEWMRPSELQATLIWAGIIGFCGAVCSIGYRVGTSFVHKILTGSNEPGLVESFTELPLWARVVVPAIGGLIAGAIIQFGSRFHGQLITTDYMEAVVLGDGRISARQSLVKSLSALFTNASGGSIGREGPLVQLAAMVASLAGRFQHWTTPRLRLLVACWSSRGNRLRLQRSNFRLGVCCRDRARFDGDGNFRAARVRVCYCHTHGARFSWPRSALSDPIVPAQPSLGDWAVPVAWSGFRSGGTMVHPAAANERKIVEQISAPVYVKMFVGGLIVGALAVFYPEVCGNGYSVVNGILGGQWLWQTVALILIFKVLATAATFGSGAVGGVFTPTLFVGASLGFLFGTVTRDIDRLGLSESQCVRNRRDGRVSGSGNSCADHGHHHDFRTHIGSPDHPPADARLRGRLLHVGQDRETLDLC